jgi:hypothetical protein
VTINEIDLIEPCLPCGATGQRRDRSLPRPTWLPDGRSGVNSSSMSELGIVCRRLTRDGFIIKSAQCFSTYSDNNNINLTLTSKNKKIRRTITLGQDDNNASII